MEIGDIIEGIIYFGGDERFHVYFLADVSILKRTHNDVEGSNLNFTVLTEACVLLIGIVTAIFLKIKRT